MENFIELTKEEWDEKIAIAKTKEAEKRKPLLTLEEYKRLIKFENIDTVIISIGFVLIFPISFIFAFNKTILFVIPLILGSIMFISGILLFFALDEGKLIKRRK